MFIPFFSQWTPRIIGKAKWGGWFTKHRLPMLTAKRKYNPNDKLSVKDCEGVYNTGFVVYPEPEDAECQRERDRVRKTPQYTGHVCPLQTILLPAAVANNCAAAVPINTFAMHMPQRQRRYELHNKVHIYMCIYVCIYIYSLCTPTHRHAGAISVRLAVRACERLCVYGYEFWMCVCSHACQCTRSIKPI